VSDTALKCPACGVAIAAGDRFCEACGQELEVVAPAGPPCPACGSTDPPVDGYCGVCGGRAPGARDHVEIELPGAAGVSDKGRSHFRNEDAMAVAVEAAATYAVIADGVSTTVDPDVVSLAAVTDALAELVRLGPDEAATESAFDRARAAVAATNFVPAADLGPPSCTYLALVVTGAQVLISSLGDCRAYWLGDDGSVEPLTTDDSWATEQIEAGLLTNDEAHADPRAHMITRWLGRDADPEWRPSLRTFVPPGGGRLLACSDGLWNYTLAPDRLARAVGERTEATVEVARRLVDFANAAGGSDNITVVLIDVPRPAIDRKGLA
jgi:serine/threonine protein phosphatase PrpC